MSTRKSKPTRPHRVNREQERERARRRAARREKSAATHRAQRKRTAQAALVVLLAVLALFAAIVWLSMALGPDDSETTPTSAESSAAGQTAPASATLPDNCTAPPAVPGPGAQIDLPDAGEAADTMFEAVITTNCGDITVDLDGSRAPQAVASFVDLSSREFYRDSPCHRLLAADNVVLQCGDPTGTGTGGPGYGYGVEYVPEDGVYPRGTLAMARTADPDQGTGSQFFVVHTESVWPPEGGGYTIFGNVTSGMEIIDQVVAAGVADGGVDGPPALPLSILRIAVTEKKV